MTDYLIGNSHSLAREFDQKLVFEDNSGNILDASAGFVDEEINTVRTYSNLIHPVPGRVTTHVPGGIQQGIIQFSFRVPVWTLNAKEAENSFEQIIDFFENAPGAFVRIYWAKDDVDGYYAYLPGCYLKSFTAVRRSNRRLREVSVMEITVESISKGWVKTFPGDTAPEAFVARGPWLHTASTNDGSPALAVIRESDQQGLLELDDQGFLRSLGPMQDNQDLSAWDLDLEDL